MNSTINFLLTGLFLLGNLCMNRAHAEDQSNAVSFIEMQLKQFSDKSWDTAQLHQFFDVYWKWYMFENPDMASLLGYAGNLGQWPDLSSEAIERRKKIYAQLRNILSSIPMADLEPEDQISCIILKRILEEEQQDTQFCNHYLLVNQMFGIHLSIPLIIDLMPTKTVSDYENILSRLHLAPQLLQQTKQLLERGIETGITPPQVALRNVPQQVNNLITKNPLESPLLKSFRHFPSSFDEETRARLTHAAEAIYAKELFPALSEFHAYLQDNYLPNCRTTIAFSDLPKGRDWYAHVVRSMTTTNLTPAEIHKIGLEEVARIKKEMFRVIETTAFSGSFKDYLHFLKTDSQFFYSNRNELLSGYKTLCQYIETQLPLLFVELPKLPFEVTPVPAYSEESQVTAYYCQGSVADHRPGNFYINTSFPQQRPKWEMIPLALHEAVPGHHLQISLAQELKQLPEFRKHTGFTSYVEGWGLYAESLGTELGLYQDPYDLFGRLSYEMLRAMRLVVDTGMHAMGWSREQAIDYFKQHVGLSDHEIVTEIDRYLAMPGQALAYKIGELKILEMRHWSIQTLGNLYDIREFHRSWLQNGTVPLDIAENQIRAWAEKTLESSTPH